MGEGDNQTQPSTAVAVEQMMRELASSLPSGVAELRVEANPLLGIGGRMLILEPSNASAAPIHIDVSDESNFVSVSLGRGALFEVPLEGGRYSSLGFLDEIRALCMVAIRGQLTETVRFKGQEVIGARASAKIGSVEVGDTWRKVFTNPLRRSRARTFTYEAYDSDGL